MSDPETERQPRLPMKRRFIDDDEEFMDAARATLPGERMKQRVPEFDRAGL